MKAHEIANKEELITALRNCSGGVCSLCPYDDHELSTKGCEAKLLRDAADALEADDKRIAELEKQDSVEMHKKQVARIAELEAQMARGKDSMRCKFAVDHGGGLVECMGYRKVCCGKQRYDTNDDGSINIVECIDVKGEQE